MRLHSAPDNLKLDIAENKILVNRRNLVLLSNLEMICVVRATETKVNRENDYHFMENEELVPALDRIAGALESIGQKLDSIEDMLSEIAIASVERTSS